MKFEVGKRYKKDVGYKHNNKPVLWVCVAIHKTIPIFCLEEPELSDIYPFTSVGNLGWVEYNEPVAHTRYLSWYRQTDGTIQLMMRTFLPAQSLGKPYQDGLLLKVDTVKYTEEQS